MSRESDLHDDLPAVRRGERVELGLVFLAVSSAATTAAAISEQLAGHLLHDLRPAQDELVTDPAR